MKKIIFFFLVFSGAILVGSAVHAAFLPSNKGYLIQTPLKNSACVSQKKTTPDQQSCDLTKKDGLQKNITLSVPTVSAQPSNQTQPANKKKPVAEIPVFIQCSGAYLGNDGSSSSNLDSGVQCLGPFGYNIQEQINLGSKTFYTGPLNQWSVNAGMAAIHLNPNPGFGSGAFRTYLLSGVTDPATRCCCVKGGYLFAPGKSNENGGTYTMRCDGAVTP